MTHIDKPTAGWSTALPPRRPDPAPAETRRQASAVEYDQLEVWPDEIRLGDIYGGFVITGIHAADHYRDPAVRLTIFTDPEMLPEGVSPVEWGRVVLRTDRDKGHPVPIERPRR